MSRATFEAVVDKAMDYFSDGAWDAAEQSILAAHDAEVKALREQVGLLVDLIDKHAPHGIGYELRRAYIDAARAVLAGDGE